MSVVVFLTTTGSTALGALVYSQNFNAFPNGTTDLGDGSTITSNNGVASVQTGGVGTTYKALRLTAETVAVTTAGWTLPDLNPGGDVTSFTASFDLLFYTAGGTPAADAFWFQFGNDSSRLEIGFITYTTNQIQIWNGGSQIGGSYGTPQVFVDTFLDKFRSTTISWNETDGLSLSYGGSSLATNLNIPGFDPVSGDVFSFYAWNGVHAQTVFVDNVSISTTATSPVPEPGQVAASLLLLGGLGGYVLLKRRKAAKAPAPAAA